MTSTTYNPKSVIQTTTVSPTTTSREASGESDTKNNSIILIHNLILFIFILF